eukprot:g5390.t1
MGAGRILSDAFALEACTESEMSAAISDALARQQQEPDARRRLLSHSQYNATSELGAATTADAVDVAFFFICAVLVLFMQCGFAMVESGTVREHNVKSILFKNLLDPCLSAIFFWAFGFAFAYGKADDSNAFIGNKLFFLTNFESGYHYTDWFFQYAFAATAATIVSGAVAERCQVGAFFLYNIFITSFVYPVVVHWVWSGDGFLSVFNTGEHEDLLVDVGMIDFAGSGVVHMTGGLAGLIGAYVLGPRSGDWKNMKVHSVPLVVFGTFILWVGWYGFNCGSTLGISGGDKPMLVGKVAVTTTLCAAASGIVSCLLWNKLGEKWSVERICNGILGGLVGITAGCNVVEPWHAVIIGVISAFVYSGSSIFVKEKLGIDDVIDASPVHFFCGIWGVLAANTFAKSDNMGMGANGLPLAGSEPGLFYEGTAGKRLGAAVTGIVTITVWVTGMMLPFFIILDKCGMLRVDFETEKQGVDVSEMGGSAYSRGAPDNRAVSKAKSFKERSPSAEPASAEPVAATDIEAAVEKSSATA